MTSWPSRTQGDDRHDRVIQPAVRRWRQRRVGLSSTTQGPEGPSVARAVQFSKTALPLRRVSPRRASRFGHKEGPSPRGPEAPGCAGRLCGVNSADCSSQSPSQERPQSIAPPGTIDDGLGRQAGLPIPRAETAGKPPYPPARRRLWRRFPTCSTAPSSCDGSTSSSSGDTTRPSIRTPPWLMRRRLSLRLRPN
jgi:hypothetical protein